MHKERMRTPLNQAIPKERQLPGAATMDDRHPAVKEKVEVRRRLEVK